MGYTPWYAHNTYPAIQIPLFLETAADNITGLDSTKFAMKINFNGSDTTGTGTFTVVTSNPAVVTYKFSDADTLIGSGAAVNLFIEATFATGSVAVYDPIPWAFVVS